MKAFSLMQAIQIQQAKTLTYAGAIPFIVFAATALTGFERLHASYFMLAYGAVIASFLAGLHWGLYLQKSMSTALNLFISSNVLTVFSWASLLIPKPLVQYSIQILCFLLLLLIDRRLYRDDVIAEWFYKLRINATAVVVTSLVLMAITA